MVFEQAIGLCFEGIEFQPINGLNERLSRRKMTVKSPDADTRRLGDRLQRDRAVTGREKGEGFCNKAAAIFRCIGAPLTRH